MHRDLEALTRRRRHGIGQRIGDRAADEIAMADELAVRGIGELDDVLVADAYYIATRSEGEDLGLLLRTPGAWVRRLRALRIAAALA